MKTVEEIIQERLQLFDCEVAPIIQKDVEDLKDITITPQTYKRYIEAFAQKCLQDGIDLDQKILGEYSYYMGKVDGLAAALRLFSLMKAPKESYDCHSSDRPYKAYRCGNCGFSDVIYEDYEYCPKCGVKLTEELT